MDINSKTKLLLLLLWILDVKNEVYDIDNKFLSLLTHVHCQTNKVQIKQKLLHVFLKDYCTPQGSVYASGKTRLKIMGSNLTFVDNIKKLTALKCYQLAKPCHLQSKLREK